jgi:dienelactone hydrolase
MAVTRIRLVAVAISVVLVWCSAPAFADGPRVGLGQFPFYEDEQAPYDWQGSWSAAEVAFPSVRTQAQLYGVLFTPKPLPSGRLPAVVIVPGSGPGVQSFYQWAARDLAGHGYVALTVDPQGVGRSETFGALPCDGEAPEVCPGVPWQQAANYVDAFSSGLTFLTARAEVDSAHLGVAGHSLGARAASFIQGVDTRVRAVVAWDNLASDLAGDAGSPSGGGAASAVIGGELPTASAPVTVRAPALGMASDTGRIGATDPDEKKTAYAHWLNGGQPAMELVFLEASHNEWVQTRQTDREEIQHIFAIYTRAWFDRFLRGDTTATEQLLATTINGRPRSSFLSTTFRSAASLDGYRCEDLLHC